MAPSADEYHDDQTAEDGSVAYELSRIGMTYGQLVEEAVYETFTFAAARRLWDEIRPQPR